ncbi:MAG: hypothetical protein R3B91_07195 [Planctomycetaceae bacterium]
MSGHRAGHLGVFTSGLAQGDEPGDHSPEPDASWPFEEDVERLGEDVPSDVVRVEIMEGVNVPRKWEFDVHQRELLFETDYFAIKNLPRHYDPPV